ncbi:hypothetical protein CP905_14330 [Klebsiella pneumoniae]|nr:hypothetical protein CP905_14330 [Klebsiella pneumoniae]
MLSLAAANVGFVILKLPASGAGAFVCFCQLVCQFCQTGVKNASVEALSAWVARVDYAGKSPC